MDELQTTLIQLTKSGFTFEPLGERDYEQIKVDTINNAVGDLNTKDGYDCPVCKNKGYLMKLQELPNGHFEQQICDCKCMGIRRTLNRMRQSGLKNVIRECTFDRYEATEDWQKLLKDKAVAYSENPQGWFFLCGQPGIGKSHLCTAICRKFLLDGRGVSYMAWRDDINKLKDYDGESEQRLKLLERFKRAEVLYIDDLFKTGNAPNGEKQRPTSADINIAFEIINYRYNNPELLTIVSSEWTMSELLGIDEATGSRIFERAGENGVNIRPDCRKNYRTRKMLTI